MRIKITAGQLNGIPMMNLHQKPDYLIAPNDWGTIIFYAEKYQVEALYLFGSSLDNPDQANDIDLAVRGIPPQLFFSFYGKLLRHLSKPVDLVDLSKKTRFSELIQERWIQIYGKKR
ncbi:hypothetical protein QUF58_09450 [Anaerolineales bacterium HSG24]|nr:hypothetical protein [Anaerolineales bacterium HSG24]